MEKKRKQRNLIQIGKPTEIGYAFIHDWRQKKITVKLQELTSPLDDSDPSFPLHEHHQVKSFHAA